VFTEHLEHPDYPPLR